MPALAQAPVAELRPRDQVAAQTEPSFARPGHRLARPPHSQEAVSVEVRANRTRVQGYAWSANGNDRFLVRTQSTGGPGQSDTGKWSFASGTGKLKGIKGSGTATCRPEGEGTVCTIEGTYQLPLPRKQAARKARP